MIKPKIIVHGGAHNREEDEAEHRQGVIAACEDAYEMLQKKVDDHKIRLNGRC